MQEDLESMDLVTIRNLFLYEMREFLKAVEFETPEQLRVRKNRIKEIDTVLEEKKRTAKFKDPGLV